MKKGGRSVLVNFAVWGFLGILYVMADTAAAQGWQKHQASMDEITAALSLSDEQAAQVYPY